MEVFVLQIVTLKKNTLIRHFIFLLILAIGFGTVVISQNTQYGNDRGKAVLR